MISRVGCTLNGIAISDASFNRRAFGVLVAGFFTVSIAYSIRYGYGMLLPPMLAELGISQNPGRRHLFRLFFCIYAVFARFWGVLSDRYNLRVILTFFTVLLAAGAGLMALTTSVVSAAHSFSHWPDLAIRPAGHRWLPWCNGGCRTGAVEPPWPLPPWAAHSELLPGGFCFP